MGSKLAVDGDLVVGGANVTTALASKANSTDVTTALALKADKSNTYTTTQVDVRIQNAIDTRQESLAVYQPTSGSSLIDGIKVKGLAVTSPITLSDNGSLLTVGFNSALLPSQTFEKVVSGTDTILQMNDKF